MIQILKSPIKGSLDLHLVDDLVSIIKIIVVIITTAIDAALVIIWVDATTRFMACSMNLGVADSDKKCRDHQCQEAADNESSGYGHGWINDQALYICTVTMCVCVVMISLFGGLRAVKGGWIMLMGKGFGAFKESNWCLFTIKRKLCVCGCKKRCQ